MQAKSTLAPALGAVTALSMGKNLKTNEVEAVEVGKQIPGQMSMTDFEDVEEPAEEKTIKTVDPSTGEIYEVQSSNVIDLRKTKQV